MKRIAFYLVVLILTSSIVGFRQQEPIIQVDTSNGCVQVVLRTNNNSQAALYRSWDVDGQYKQIDYIDDIGSGYTYTDSQWNGIRPAQYAVRYRTGTGIRFYQLPLTKYDYQPCS